MNRHFLSCVIFILGFIMVSATVIPRIDANRLLKISIYFSSLCPGSRDFIVRHLYPNYKSLKGRIIIEWIIYQQESYRDYPMKDDTPNFYCEHGPKECEFNRYIACALNQGKGQDRDVNFINCVMLTFDFDRCLREFGYRRSEFQICIRTRGYSLLSNYMHKISRVKPKRLTFLPAVIYNDNDNENIDHSSLSKFLETVCTKLMSPLPDVCHLKMKEEIQEHPFYRDDEV